MKNFFRVSISKIVLSAILVAVSYFYVYQIPVGAPGRMVKGHGLPLSYIGEVISTLPHAVEQSRFSVVYLSLGIDIIFWYVISCLLVYLWRRKHPDSKRT